MFAAAGAHVLVSDINEEPRSGDRRAHPAGRGLASFCAADVSKADDAETMVRTAVERYGRLDCAVNNAAVTPDTHPIADLDEQEFDRILAVDLKGVALCLKYEIAQMLEQGDGGAIVNIGSVSSSGRSRTTRRTPQQSTASSASPRWPRSRMPPAGSASTRSAPEPSTPR